MAHLPLFDPSVCRLTDSLLYESHGSSAAHQSTMNLLAQSRMDSISCSAVREAQEKTSRARKLAVDEHAWRSYQNIWHDNQRTEVSGHEAQLHERLERLQSSLHSAQPHRGPARAGLDARRVRAAAAAAYGVESTLHLAAERVAMDHWDRYLPPPGPYGDPGRYVPRTRELSGLHRDPMTVERERATFTARLHKHESDILLEQQTVGPHDPPAPAGAVIRGQLAEDEHTQALMMARVRVWFTRQRDGVTKGSLRESLQVDRELCRMLGVQPGTMPAMELAADEVDQPVELPQFEAFFLQLWMGLEQNAAAQQEAELQASIDEQTSDVHA